ncbi:MAG: hypothetical protein JETCAE03_32980 [Ignavibacteriaceae bacterium]|jgi:hypothetical protein|nr:MAG: hypothetical protein JETCAE03_32980 [Ignavibacteriaceae bacterium]
MMEIPYGSPVRWAVRPQDLKGYEKVFDILQNKITGYPETHYSTILSKYSERPGWYYEYELSVTARINQFYPNKNAKIYDLLAPIEVKQQVLIPNIKETYGKVYGLWQTPYFGIRRLAEEAGWPKYPGKQIPNLMAWLGICSEHGFVYLYGTSEIMGWYDVTNYMSRRWTKDTFHSGDAGLVLDYMEERGHVIEITKEILTSYNIK